MDTKEQKQLIEKMQMLRDIKPNREWVLLTKSEILNSNAKMEPKIGIWNLIRNLDLGFRISPRRIAYSFATLLLVVAGFVGFTNFTTPDEQIVAVSKQTPEVRQKVVAINSKIKDLTQELRMNPEQNPQTIKDIVASLKTLADVPGTDLTSTSTLNADLQDLYGVIAANQITALQKTTLTDAQQKIISKAMELYNDGKYNEALEMVLMINKTEQK